MKNEDNSFNDMAVYRLRFRDMKKITQDCTLTRAFQKLFHLQNPKRTLNIVSFSSVYGGFHN